MDSVSKNYSNLLIDANRRSEPVSAVVVCAGSLQANTAAFIFVLSTLPLGVRVGMEISLYCVMLHRWEAQSLLSAGAHLMSIGSTRRALMSVILFC